MTGTSPRQRPRIRPATTTKSARRSERRRNRGILIDAIRQIPAFVKLMVGLIRDRKVSLADKLMVGGALAYLFMPADLLPDLVPFMGMVDDMFVLATALRRLLRNAGFQRALRYWKGDPADLKRLRIDQIIQAAASFLPRRIRNRLMAQS
jgi:uncharacterized membrane protein YkvA (DUF1232 family)